MRIVNFNCTSVIHIATVHADDVAEGISYYTIFELPS